MRLGESQGHACVEKKGRKMRQRLGPLNIFWLFISLPPPSYEFRPGVLLNSALCVPEARVYACVYVYVCEFVCVCVLVQYRKREQLCHNSHQ